MSIYSIIIEPLKLSSAIFAGIADGNWVSSFVDSALQQPWVQKIVSVGNDILNSFQRAAQNAWRFFTQWFRDDPVGASAGAVAAVLTLGVLIVIGGKVAAFIGGLSLLGKLKLAITAAIGLISIGAVIRHIVRGTQFLWNFNLNITDTQIRQQQKTALNSLYSLAGDSIGYLLGAVVCGSSVAGGVGLVRLDLKSIVNVIRTLAIDEDVRQEIETRFQSLINGAFRVASNIAFLELFKNARKLIKSVARRPAISAFLPDSWEKVIEAWGKEGSEAWSIASAIEGRIEAIEDEKIKAFVESAYEAFTDACTETTLTLSTYSL